MALEADGPDACRRAARLMIKQGADFLKVMATGGIYTPGQEPGATQLDLEELRAVVHEAHKAGKRVAAHAEGTQGIKNSLLAGADTIEHGIYLDQECIDLMLEKETWLVPTLVALWRMAQAVPESGVPTFAAEKAKRAAEAHLESFSRALRNGVRIAVGTDAGSPYNPPADIVTELELMMQGGATAADVLRSVTWHAAQALGLDGVGLIEPGWEADLIVLEKDPFHHLDTLRHPLMVFRGGRPLPIRSL
jgi:imidazolonepropionase-like amidohydrolase